MEIILSSIYALLLSLIVYKSSFFKVENINPIWFVAVFAVKLIAALLLTWIYTSYYTDRATADIFKYFDDGKAIFASLKHSPYDYFRILTGFDSDSSELKKYYLDCNHWYKKYDYMMYNDNRTIIRFNAFIMLFSFGNFFVHNVFMSFLSLIGLTAIFKIFVSKFPDRIVPLFIVIFLLPSSILWTSAALKEGLVVFAFGLFFYSLWKILYEKLKVSYFVVLLLTIVILLLAKYYVIACAMPGVLFLIIKRFLPHISSKIILLSILVLCLSSIFIGHYIGGVFDVINTLTYKQNDFVNYSLSLTDVGSLIDTYKLKPSLVDFLIHSPKALLNSLFLPMPWNIHNIMAVIPAFENVVLLVLLLVILFYNRKQSHANQLIIFSLLFVICLNILNGLIVPVFGALVRYKVPALPFLYACLVVLIYVPFVKNRTFFL